MSFVTSEAPLDKMVNMLKAKPDWKIIPTKKGVVMRTLEIRLVLIAAVLLSGCVTSHQARSVKPSSFLGDSASLLGKGRKGEEALLVYRKPGTDWRSYDKIILDPVTIWGVENSTLPPAELADYQKLVDNFYLVLKDKLSKIYVINDQPGPGVMRIQAAILNGAQANRALKVAKVIAPYAGYADVFWTFATGKPAFTGEVSFEYTIKDSRTGELLGEGADRRVGGNQIGRHTLTSWGDVQNILLYWSDATVYWLCTDRARSDCQKPNEGLLKGPLM